MIKNKKLKYFKKGDPIPADFWNYDLNIVLGYKHINTVNNKNYWKISKKKKNDSTSQ